LLHSQLLPAAALRLPVTAAIAVQIIIQVIGQTAIATHIQLQVIIIVAIAVVAITSTITIRTMEEVEEQSI